MSAESVLERLSLRSLLRGFAAWAAAAALLLPCAALAVWKLGVGSAQIGYLSSALSFLTAAAAGACAARAGSRGLLPALAGALLLTVALVTAGFLIGGMPEPSALLSLASFTITGFLAGSLVLPGGKKERRRRAAGNRRREKRKFP